MSVIIIGEVSENVVLLRRYLNRVGIIDIHHVASIEKVGGYLPHHTKKNTIKLIILDVVPTKTDEKELCEKIERLNEWVDIPIILSIPSGKKQMIDKALDAGIFDFISKPLKFTHFKARVHAALKYWEESRLRKLEKERLQMELSIAKKVQKHALTPSLQMKEVQFDGLCMSSEKLGGDMYSWFRINNHLTGVILYDVMGHGVASSLVAMSIRSLLKGLITRLIDPTLVMTEFNRHVYELFADEDNLDSFLATAIYVLIDTEKGTIQYANAAHPSGFLFNKHGEVSILSANVPILGLFPDIEVGKQTIQTTEWNRIILFTDGLLTLKGNQSVDADLFRPYLEQENGFALKRFAQDHDLFEKDHSDDITVVSITIHL